MSCGRSAFFPLSISVYSANKLQLPPLRLRQHGFVLRLEAKARLTLLISRDAEICDELAPMGGAGRCLDVGLCDREICSHYYSGLKSTGSAANHRRGVQLLLEQLTRTLWRKGCRGMIEA
jgi:hypothetical protein